MLFDSTIRKELAKSFGATLVVILTIVITMMLIRVIGLAANGQVAPQDVALLLGYFALGHLPTMMALSMFIAVVVSLGRMYRDSEMVVWFASGLSLARFVRPVLHMAWPMLLVIAALLLFVWPWGKRSGEELRSRYEQRSDLSRVTPGVFQASRDGSRVFFVDSASREGVIGHQVFVLARQRGAESVTTAHSGQVVQDGADRLLRLQSGQRNEAATDGGHTLASFSQYELVIGENTGRDAVQRLPSAIDTIDLLRSPTPRNQGELAWRFGLMLAAANLLLLGIGLSASAPRRASNWNLLFALLAFVVYFNLVNLSQAWIAAGRFAAMPLMLVLHGGALCIGAGLIWWRDWAGVLTWPRAARRRASSQ